MTLQDLKDNRDRIIKVIRWQSKEADIKAVMSKMLIWLNNRQDIKDMKATKANVDKFANMVTISWIKNDWKPVIDHDKMEEELEKRKRESHSTFY